MKKYIVALDQGTTSSRAVIFDREQNVISSASKEFLQIYPRAGWVEHNPADILSSQLFALDEAIKRGNIQPSEIAAIGITNQRETTVIWNRFTGEPVCNAIVWQCRRTDYICEDLKKNGKSAEIRQKTGLLPDAYFSGTKIKWILDNIKGARESADKGELLFGTVDTFLLWHLTKGDCHITDYTNASRTMLFDINRLCWDESLCKMLDIPTKILPEVRKSSCVFGYTEIDGVKIPIASLAGDQQAALFGQCCFEKGECKNTYGTGCFALMNVGDKPIVSQSGLLTTLAASDNLRPLYVLEGSVFIGGAVMQWLRDEMGLIKSSAEAGIISASVESSGGVYLVPAFTGLGAPYWDMYARGAIFGITRGTTSAHIVRAAEESIAFQSALLIKTLSDECGFEINSLCADGGACADEFLMQFQADILGIPVCVPVVRETTALGAAMLAGLAVGFWKDRAELKALRRIGKTHTPQMDLQKRKELLENWDKAVKACREFK